MPALNLQFHNYTVERLVFENTPQYAAQQEFELHPNFQQKVASLGNGCCDVHLSVAVDPAVEHPSPFRLFVSLVGHFSVDVVDDSMDNLEKDIVLRKDTVSILFPFLRAIVASLTTAANVPPLILPIMDFSPDQ